jgi:predicted short-subunit dehydrogenase-like oxidoreductase (DUF2520 family)
MRFGRATRRDRRPQRLLLQSVGGSLLALAQAVARGAWGLIEEQLAGLNQELKATRRQLERITELLL